MNTRKSQKDTIVTPARATRAKSADRVDRGNITLSDLVDDIMAKGVHGGTPKYNPNSPLTMGLMMELLKKMETNINARINSKIDEVKAEVGLVRNHLQHFDTKFEVIEQRIGIAEDHIENVEAKLDDAQ